MRPSEIFQNIKLIVSFVFCVLRMFVSTWGKALEVANKSNAEIANTPEDAINSSDIDAVLIASATPTHIQFIKMIN